MDLENAVAIFTAGAISRKASFSEPGYLLISGKELLMKMGGNLASGILSFTVVKWIMET
jgi:hypothetical protein